jgi:exonuclease VII large subunit
MNIGKLDGSSFKNQDINNNQLNKKEGNYSQLSKEDLIKLLNNQNSLQEMLTNISNELNEVKNKNAELRKSIVGLIDNEGNLIDDSQLTQRIINNVKEIYDSVSVSSIDYIYGNTNKAIASRKIELKRTWCWMDSIPLISFASVLLKPDSIYRKTLNEQLICKFILEAELVIDSKLKESIFETTLKEMKNKNITVKSEHKQIAEKFITDKDWSFQSSSEDKNLISFLQEYKKEYELVCGNGKESIKAAYWQSKSITIYVPNEISHLYFCELRTEGIINPIAIGMGKLMRFLYCNPDLLTDIKN